ncbi:MAG: hypothetical protein ACOCU5_00690 [Bacillota bacterium]
MLKKILNSDVGYFIYTGLVIVAGIGSLVFFYFMVTGFNIGVYDENTMVGSVYVGGLDEDEAERKVRDRINEWLEEDDVVYEIGYQGYYYTFDRELFTFDVDETMDNVREGTTTPIAVSYSPGALNTIEFEISQEPFMEDLQDVFDFEAVIEDVLDDAAVLREFSRMELSQYFLDRDLAVETIHEVTMPYPQGVDEDEFLGKLDEAYEDRTVSLGPRETFSVQERFDETFTSSELNALGSILLEVILPTDMVLIERHYNPQIDFNQYTVEDYPYYGRNVRVNRNIGYDFVFENVNEQNYEFEFFEGPDDRLGVRLIGPPYLNSFSVTDEDDAKTYLEHGTETTSDPDSVRVGRDGVAVIMRREERDIHDEVVEDYEVVFEYYPSISEVTLED